MRRTSAILLVALAILAWAALVSPGSDPVSPGGAIAPPAGPTPGSEACLQVWMRPGASEPVPAPDAPAPGDADPEAALRARVRSALLGDLRP